MEKLSERWIITDINGVDRHLEEQAKANAPTAENLELVAKIKKQEPFLRKLMAIADKNNSNYAHPEVINYLKEIKEMDIFKNDPMMKEWFLRLNI
jgi:hypothetical protein